MPWCSKCKMEYIEGVTVCPDCGQALITDLDAREFGEEKQFIYTGEPFLTSRLTAFLQYSGLESVENGELADDLLPILVSEKEYAEAKKLVLIFLQNELPAKELSEKDDDTAPEEAAKPAPAPYVKKAVQYEDLNSSAITLITVGSVGFLFLFLNLTGILHLSFGSAALLFYIVMGVMFGAFLFFGISTWKSAKKVKGEIKEETEATEAIRNWFMEHYSSPSIDAACLSSEDETTEEMKYFLRTAFIKQELNENLTELDEAYLEDITESFYTELYGEFAAGEEVVK